MSWASKPLNEILEQSGRHRAGDQDLPVLSITMKYGLVDQADKFKKRVASSDTSTYRIAYKNELVVGFPIDEGVLGFQTKYPAGIVSPAYDIWKLRNEGECHIPYLDRYFRSPQARSLYASRMQGAVARRRSLTKTDFLKLEIPFPPLDYQKRIAHLLGKVEGLIAQRKQHLKQFDDLLKSVFLEMFGDPVWNEKGWDVKEITEVCDEIVDCVNKTAPQVEERTPFIMVRTSNIRDGKISLDKIKYVDAETYRIWTRRSQPRIGDILFTREAPMGEVGMVDFEAQIFLGQRIVQYRCNLNLVNQKFILELMKTRFFKRQIEKLGKGSTVKHLAVPDCFKFMVIVPPLPIQDQFATFVEKVESLKSRYQQSLTDLENLYGALSQQAFKGELDLSRVPLPPAKD